MQLASRFGKNARVLRSSVALDDDAIRAVAPSIFAEAAHGSRSERYSYIPTSSVLAKLRKEGFQPFMVAQTKTRLEDRTDFTKHMLRLRYAGDIAKGEANEVILLNSHDGTSSYQMLAGMFRQVCQNGLVCGEIVEDVRVRHKGDISGEVIEGAFTILDGFGKVEAAKGEMKALSMGREEAELFGKAALSLKYGEGENGESAAPVTPAQVLRARRWEDEGSDLWSVFNRTQENLLQGGLRGRGENGRRVTTRGVSGIDTGIKLNRALWMLAEGMKGLKTGQPLTVN